jgi:hypothetical protein
MPLELIVNGYYSRYIRPAIGLSQTKNKQMKQFFSAITMAAMLACTACGNSAEKTTTTATDTAAAVVKDTVAAAPVKPAFKPMDVIMADVKVKSYARWRPAFDADSADRIANGMGLIVVGKSQKDSNSLVVVLSVADMQKAKAFESSPKHLDAMKKRGVIAKPMISYFNIIRMNPDSKEKQWVVITHKVKNFDAWLKVFDAEGTAARANYGLVDVALGRDLSDSNNVQIVFDITDMAKAKARLADPALKKLMTDGGVISAPKSQIFTTAE